MTTAIDPFTGNPTVRTVRLADIPPLTEAKLPVRSGNAQTLTAASTIAIAAGLRDRVIEISSASAITLTSVPTLTTTGITSGQMVVLVNVGSFAIVLQANSVLAGSKINTDQNVTIGAGRSVTFIYSSTLSAWEMILSRSALALGTLASQDAIAIAITGGAIDGTPIGATTPSTVKGTSLTGTNLTSTRIPVASTNGQLINSTWTIDAFGSVGLPVSSNVTMTANQTGGFALAFRNGGGADPTRNGIQVVAGNNTGNCVFLRFASADSSLTWDFSAGSTGVSLNKPFNITDATASALTVAGGATINGALKVSSGGSAISRMLLATSAALDTVVIASASFTTITVTVTGATVGDQVDVNKISTSPNNNISVEGYVSAANTVTVVARNHTMVSQTFTGSVKVLVVG